MIYTEGETIAYPFSASYLGTVDDMGDTPSFLIHIYSMEVHELLDVNAYLDILSVSELEGRTIITGTIFIPRLNNTLIPGSYRIKLAVKLNDELEDLMYSPISIEQRNKNFYVATINKRNVTQTDVQDYMRNLVDPGVRTGFKVKHSFDSYYIDVEPGVLYTHNGVKIDHMGTKKAARIREAGVLDRIDAICVYFDDYSDEIITSASPKFRIIEGPEIEGSPPPAIPPNYTPISWARIPGGSTSCEQITFSLERNHVGKRPFFHVPSVHTGDGVRSIFEFPTEVVKGTSEVDVDGVGQVLDEDYRELESKLSKCKIQFIGEVPKEGQRVSISGQRYTGPYYDFNYSIYATADAEIPLIRHHPTTGLMGEYLASSFSTDECFDTMVQMPQMKAEVIERAPSVGWNASMGYYMYFTEKSNMILDLSELDHFPGEDIVMGLLGCRIALQLDISDMPESIVWTRLLKIGDNTVVYAIKSASSIRIVVDHGSVRLSEELLLAAVPENVINVNLSLGSGTDLNFTQRFRLMIDNNSDNVTIQLEGATTSGSSDSGWVEASGISNPPINFFSKWTVGNTMDASTPNIGNSFRGYISKFLIYTLQ